MSHWANEKATGMRQIDEPTYSTPNTDKLHLIHIPTLLLWGKYDFVCPDGLAHDIELRSGSSDLSKIIYAHSGHSPMVNETELFWKDVLEWIGKH